MEMIGGILGGIGIFLVGMALLTDGLKSAAGDALRSMLQRFTGGPATAVLSGTAVTALVQSSSATTLTTIGFVSAGLLTFPQALGVILGANLGTTSTGWLVSLIGFRVSLSAVAFPLVGIGAILHLLARNRASHVGMAVAGFGLIFVGIGVLQSGMEGLAELVDPSAFPGATIGGRIGLVALGLVMTVVMQSSSAAVAMTLTGLHTGSLGLEQAAFLVVGQNMGTTVKAALASIGGSVPVKRTALAHILFNLLTGVLAIVFLPVLLRLAVWMAGDGGPAVAIAFFHTAFNLLGVVAVFPVIGRFASFVERLIPDPESTLTQYLDVSVAQLPSVAVEAARRSVMAVALLLFDRSRARLNGSAGAGRVGSDPVLEQVAEALARIRKFLAEVRTSPSDHTEHARHLSVLHAVDHLDGFLTAFRELQSGGYRVDPDHGLGLGDGWRALADALKHPGEREAVPAERQGEDGGERPGVPDPAALEQVSAELATLRKVSRARVLEATAQGTLTPDQAWKDIELSKVLDRLGYHAWRTSNHLWLADPNRLEDETEGELES